MANRGKTPNENSMTIDIDTVKKVADLARIKVADDALEGLAQELSQIIGFMEQLNEVDIEGIEPTTAVMPMPLKLRSDEVREGSQAEAILKNAPDAQEGFFAVPKVIE